MRTVHGGMKSAVSTHRQPSNTRQGPAIQPPVSAGCPLSCVRSVTWESPRNLVRQSTRQRWRSSFCGDANGTTAHPQTVTAGASATPSPRNLSVTLYIGAQLHDDAC